MKIIIAVIFILATCKSVLSEESLVMPMRISGKCAIYPGSVGNLQYGYGNRYQWNGLRTSPEGVYISGQVYESSLIACASVQRYSVNADYTLNAYSSIASCAYTHPDFVTTLRAYLENENAKKVNPRSINLEDCSVIQCADEKAALMTECGSESNIEIDEITCEGECICSSSDGSIGDLYLGDWSSLQNEIVCLEKNDNSGNACTHLINNVNVDPWFDENVGEPYSWVEMVRYAQPCSPATPDIVPSPVQPPKSCDQIMADCMIECGSPQLVDVNECDPDTGEGQCECIPMSNCDQKNTACVNQCGGADNIAQHTCEMVAGIPTDTTPCSCIAPADEKSCADYEALCVTQCGGAENISVFGCEDKSWGPQLTASCQCENPPPTCPEGEICPDDGYCQPGESDTSNDCMPDSDKDGCPDGQICAGDGVCQAGESKDSYDCGGNNDGNEHNDGGGTGESDGPRPCPPGNVCSGDGICQPGESATAVDCVGPQEEGEAGTAGTGTGLCPEGSVCHGDGICQPSEPSTAVDCAGLNYTSTRVNQMVGRIKGSQMLSPLKSFDVPSGGSPLMTQDLGRLGGVQTFDFSKFRNVWIVLNGVLCIAAAWIGIRIITLKR